MKKKVKKLSIDKKKLYTLEVKKDHFATLCRSVINQQLSNKAAASILKKFKMLWPKKKFPTPQDVLKATPAKLRTAGISAQKAGYLKDLARKFLDGTINPKKFPRMSDDEIIAHLTAVKGVGVWTAHMFLIFALGRPDVLPVGDLAIRRGFQKAYGLRTEPSETLMRELAAPHKGEHSYLALHLWNIMDAAKKK